AGVRARQVLRWGADCEGGGPYVYPDPANPRRMTGFEAELADMLAGELGVRAQFVQGPWQNLPALLGTGQIDVVLNGYELTPARVGRMAHTQPYYVYQLVLLARRNRSRLTSWDDLRAEHAGSHKFKIGVLEASGAHAYLAQHYADDVEIVVYEGTTDAMREVETGKLDATLADTPAAVFYRDRFRALEPIGSPVSKGYYVIFAREGETALCGVLDVAIEKLLASGQLRELYKKYGIWNDAQDELTSLGGVSDGGLGVRATELRGWAVIRSRGRLLVEAAGMTILLACTAMPLAMLIGLAVALGRMFGPAPLRWLLVAYIEILRGTPLMLQLFVIFFMLPEIGIAIPAIYAAVAGLAINYSAYEAEIYRAGLQAVPRGQMEAALALGMSPALALRRIVIPQAARIVVPPVTNDFIAMFKDTSVCSVITVMELTKQYSVQRNDTGATLELAALTALLYLLMSIPLARLATVLEQRLAARGRQLP
ncbi:MAG TPA: ABC transporter substrate-binding protein/permease, partial [Pirellulales bacterium]|nr:ABC transporter substrate-binding protein/permease [Pirellulales bacterium]